MQKTNILPVTEFEDKTIIGQIIDLNRQTRKDLFHKYVIFNLNGTLVDSLKYQLNYLRNIYSQYGDFDEQIFDTSNFKKTIKKRKSCTYSFPEILKETGFKEQDYFEIYKKYKKYLKENPKIPFFDGIENLLWNLNNSGITLGVVSNNSPNYILRTLNSKIVYFDYYSIYSKKDYFDKEEILKTVRKKNNLSYSDVIYVGDTYEDYFAANGAKVHFIGASWGNGIKEDDKIDSIAKNPENLENKIKVFFKND